MCPKGYCYKGILPFSHKFASLILEDLKKKYCNINNA